MDYEALKQLPPWVQEIHSACERLSDACLKAPAENYPDVKALRDQAEAVWLGYVGASRTEIHVPISTRTAR